LLTLYTTHAHDALTPTNVSPVSSVAKQIANFIYSLPQLFKVIPCPRHRMPGYDRDTDRLVVSTVQFDERELRCGGGGSGRQWGSW
jgi:hypothetical protein